MNSEFGNRDAKIIRENPDKAPYELLDLGLSKAAYERMVKAETPKPAVTEPKAATPAPEPVAPPTTALTPDIVEQTTKKKPAQPRLGRTAAQITTALSGKPRQVTVIGPTGIPKLMADKQAEKLVQRNPHLYQIVQHGK